MKRILLALLIYSFLPDSIYGSIDWKLFMTKQDMIWTRLPQTWYEAPFMGNGNMGTYLCEEPGKNAIRIDVGNNMVHDYRKEDVTIYGRGRLLIGYFLLQPVGEITTGELKLDLWNAEATGTIHTNKGEIKLRACVTSEHPYILVEAEGTGKERDFKWQFFPEKADSPRQLSAIQKKNKHFREDYISNPAPQVYDKDGISICWQPLIDGGGTATAWKELLRTKLKNKFIKP